MNHLCKYIVLIVCFTQVHTDDVLSLSFSAPSTLATGAYDGEIIIWNNNSEQASKRLLQRTKQHGSQKPAEASSGVPSKPVLCSRLVTPK